MRSQPPLQQLVRQASIYPAGAPHPEDINRLLRFWIVARPTERYIKRSLIAEDCTTVFSPFTEHISPRGRFIMDAVITLYLDGQTRPVYRRSGEPTYDLLLMKGLLEDYIMRSRTLAESAIII